jgi:hypothetical protein
MAGPTGRPNDNRNGDRLAHIVIYCAHDLLHFLHYSISLAHVQRLIADFEQDWQ